MTCGRDLLPISMGNATHSTNYIIEQKFVNAKWKIGKKSVKIGLLEEKQQLPVVSG